MKFLTLLPFLGLTAASAIPKNQQDDDCCPVGGTLTPPYVAACGYYEISAKRPDQHFPPSLSPKVTPNDLCFITNLELPPSAAGKTCTLKFLLPTQQQAHQWYHFSGPGHFNFTGYATGVGADDTTTFNHQPAPGPSPPSPPEILPGNAYTIFSGPCGVTDPSGPTTVSGSLCSKDSTLSFTQSEGPDCPIGFFVEIS